MMTDPIADMLTRMRNAIAVKKEYVEVPASRVKIQMCQVLKEEGFIRDYEVIDDGKSGILKIQLKYFYPEPRTKISGIRGLRRVSKPGRRVYVGVKELKMGVMRGTGIYILSTPKGIMSNTRAMRENVGGEVLAEVW